MNKQIYFAISYSKRDQFNNEIAKLVNEAKKLGIDVLVFVDRYNFTNNQEDEMMQAAFKEIDASDFLIAELTYKSIGVGIEVGYAFAKNKPIIYIRKKNSAYSTTTAGCADKIIIYKNTADLIKQLIKFLKDFF